MMVLPAGGTVFDDLDADRPWHDEAFAADLRQDDEAVWAARLPVLARLLQERFTGLLELAATVPGWLPGTPPHRQGAR